MSTFCEEVRESISDDLEAIGAAFLREARQGEEVACYFSVRDRVMAITYAPRDNATCRVSPPGQRPPFDHRAWETLWSAMGLTKNNDTIEGFNEYMALFPDDSGEYMQFMGKCLVKFFNSRN